MKFEPIVPSADLDVHECPRGPWVHVAVICFWRDKPALRKRWSSAAVVGCLQTIRGIDEFCRSLLKNPQIQAVVLDGSDPTPGAHMREAFDAIWKGDWSQLSEDLHPYMWDLVVADVRLVTKDQLLGVGDLDAVLPTLRPVLGQVPIELPPQGR